MKKLVPLLMAFGACASAFAVEPETQDASKHGYVEINGEMARIAATTKILGFSADDTSTFTGAALGTGIFFGESKLGYHQLGADLGYLTGDDNEDGTKQDDRIITGLVTYNYNFALPNQVGTLYVGASGGIAQYNSDIDDQTLGKATFTDSALAFGIQAGARFNVSESVSINAGYRMLAIGDMDDEIYGVKAELSDIVAHEFRAGVTYRF